MKKFLLILFWVFFVSFASAEYFQDYSTAYNWAYENWIVKEKSIWDANLYSAISRIEFAAILKWYAENILKMKDDEDTACKLIDITNLSDSYKKAATWMCQKWIMWVWQSYFRPYDTLSLANFWTTLSRLFWWEKFSNGSPYYADHIGALRSIWVIWNISDPFEILMKWDVLVMLMNSVKSINYDNPIKTTKSSESSGSSSSSETHDSASEFPVNDKILQCYREIDECRSSFANSDIACPFVCCDKYWEWISAFSEDNKCAPRDGIIIEEEPVSDNNDVVEEVVPEDPAQWTGDVENHDAAGETGEVVDEPAEAETWDVEAETWDILDPVVYYTIKDDKLNSTCPENWLCWFVNEQLWAITLTKYLVTWQWTWVLTDQDLEVAKEFIWADAWFWQKAIDVLHKDNVTNDQLKMIMEHNYKIDVIYSLDS